MINSVHKMYIQESAEKTDKLIAAFKKAIREKKNPNDYQEIIYKSLKIDPLKDLTASDISRLTREVEKYARNYL